MGTTYTRQSSFSDGDTITAALFNDEYNQLLNAFAYASSGTTGHQHDGTAAEGGNIHTIGDQDFLNKIVADSTNNRWGVFVEVSSAAVEQIRIQDGAIVPVTDNDIDLGSDSLEFKDIWIDGTAYLDSATITTADISSIYNTSLKLGRASDSEYIDFSQDNEVRIAAGNVLYQKFIDGEDVANSGGTASQVIINPTDDKNIDFLVVALIKTLSVLKL